MAYQRIQTFFRDLTVFLPLVLADPRSHHSHGISLSALGIFVSALGVVTGVAGGQSTTVWSDCDRPASAGYPTQILQRLAG